MTKKEKRISREIEEGRQRSERRRAKYKEHGSSKVLKPTPMNPKIRYLSRDGWKER